MTTKKIAAGEAPVLHVTHDLDDHGWQFLSWDHAAIEDSSLVCLSEIVDRHPEVVALAEMPPGWHAWRLSPADPWVIEVNPNEDGDPGAG